MSYFRNLNKVVSSQLFARPNNLFLSSCFRPIFLEKSHQTTIEYVHSAKALLTTIEQLEDLKSTSGYDQVIEQELGSLQLSRQDYGQKVKEFIIKGGLLTGQGIANTYYGAEKFGISGEWLDKNVHHSIPQKYQLMTRQNLLDTLEGVKKYHSGSPYISTLEEQLTRKGEQRPQYVKHLPNETIRFEYEDSFSNNALIRAIQRGHPVWRYKVQSLASQALNKGKVHLHSL